jgi:membrane protease YdiL (CAAX protease family)
MTSYGRIVARGHGIRLECVVLAVYVLLRAEYSLGTFVSHSRLVNPDRWPSTVAEAGLIALLVWMAWASGDEVSSFGFKRPTWIDGAFLSLGLIACSVENYVRMLTRLRGVSYHITFDFMKAAGMFPVFVIPAFFEELLYRGLIQARFSEALRSPWAGILISTLLFTSTHIYQGTAALPWHFCFALFMAILRWRGASLWTLTLIHAGSNAMLFGLIPQFHR